MITNEFLMSDEILQEWIERDNIFQLWNETGLIKSIKDKELVSCLLESQLRYSEEDTPFKRLSVPIVRRMMDHSIASEIVSVQPAITSDLCYYRKVREGNEVWIQKKFIQKKDKIHKSATWDNPENEVNFAAEISAELACEFDRHVITRLRDGCKTIFQWDYAAAIGDTIKEKIEDFYIKLRKMSKQMEEAFSSDLNWVVTSPEIVSFLDYQISRVYPHRNAQMPRTMFVGTLFNKYKVYMDYFFAPNQMLFGGVKEKYDPSYVIVPSLMCGKDESNLFFSYGEHLCDNNAYCMLNVNNIIL